MSKLNILQVLQSVLAAFLGVQSEKNRQRDFQHGSLMSYIIAGLLLTLLFIVVIAKLAVYVSGS